MPTVHVPVKVFNEGLGKTMTLEQLEELCFEFGMEVELLEEDPKEPIKYAFETPSNRNDLLCSEGIIRSLAIYMGLAPMPCFTPIQGSEKIVVTKSVIKYKFK